MTTLQKGPDRRSQYGILIGWYVVILILYLLMCWCMLLFELVLPFLDCTWYVYTVYTTTFAVFFGLHFGTSMALHHARTLRDLCAYPSQTLSKPKGDASKAQMAKRCCCSWHIVFDGPCVCVCVCVWVELLKRSKTCTSITWQYVGNIWIYSLELLLHLVFRMSICLFFLCLLKKIYPHCSTILAGGQGLQWWPCLTKLVTGGEAESDQLCVPAFWSRWTTTWWTLLKHWSRGFLSLGFCFKLLVPTHWRWNMHHYHELGTERAISLIQVCILWWMSDKVPQGQGFDPEQPLPRGKHDWEKLNVEFTIFNLVIRLSILPRVLPICQPFQLCTPSLLRLKQVVLTLLPLLSPLFESCLLVFCQDELRRTSWSVETSWPQADLPLHARHMLQIDWWRCQVCRLDYFSLVLGKVQSCINSRLNWQLSRV